MGILAQDYTPSNSNEVAPAPNSNEVAPAPNSNEDPPAQTSNEAAPPPKIRHGNTALILQYRNELPEVPHGRVDDHSHLAMPLLFKFLCHIDDQHANAQPNTKLPRRCSLLPYKNGLACSYVTMGSNCLCYLLRLANVQGVGKVKDWTEEDGDAWFREYFDVKRFEKGGWKFGGTISTDGKGVSILLRRPKRKRTISEPPLPKMEDDPVIWGVDPGRKNLVTAVNSREGKLSYKTNRFYDDAYCTRSKEVIEAIYEERPDIKADFKNMPTNKTASLPMLNNYVEYLLPRLMKLLRFHMDEDFRGLRFRRHQAREKALDNLCQLFTKEAGRKTIVGLGDWGNDPGGIVKGHPVGPVKGFGKWLRRYCIVISIDEHRTSMLHHRCHMEMVGQRVKIFDKDGKLQPRVSYSGRYCSYCQKKKEPRGCCANRDENAAWNMLMLTEQWLSNLPRPLNFRKGLDAKLFTPFSLESISAPSTHGLQP